MESEIIELMVKKQRLTERKTKELEEKLKKAEKYKRSHQLKAFAYRQKERQWRRGERTADNPHGDLPATGFTALFRERMKQAEAEREAKKKQKEDKAAEAAKSRKRQQDELPSLVLNPKKRRVVIPTETPATTSEVPESLSVFATLPVSQQPPQQEDTRTPDVSIKLEEYPGVTALNAVNMIAELHLTPEQMKNHGFIDQAGELTATGKWYRQSCLDEEAQKTRLRAAPAESMSAPPGAVRTEITESMQRRMRQEAAEQRLIEEEPYNPWTQRRVESPPIFLQLQASKVRKSVVFQDREYRIAPFVSVEPYIDLCEPEDVKPKAEALDLTTPVPAPTATQEGGSAAMMEEATADNVVGGPPEINPAFPPEYITRRRVQPPRLTSISAQEAFKKNLEQRPWQMDNEEVDSQLVRAPPATASRATTEGRLPRTCWVRLRRSWLKTNFLTHLIGQGNIRYRNVTYASICHHPSTSWDTHPMCWQCYIELDLPRCGVDVTIMCPYCDMMGAEATKLRNSKLKSTFKPRAYAIKSGLPQNVYCQADADEWLKAKHFQQWPNPDWTAQNQPVGNCFPGALITPGESVAEAIARNPDWSDSAKIVRETKARNKLERPQAVPQKTPSDYWKPMVPKCLVWGEEPVALESCEATSELLAPWSASLKASKVDYIDPNIKAVMALARKFMSEDVLKAKPANVTTEEWNQFIEIVRATDVSNMLGGADAVLPPEMTEEKVQGMSLDQLRTTVLKQQQIIHKKVEERAAVCESMTSETEKKKEDSQPIEQLEVAADKVKKAATVMSRRASTSSSVDSPRALRYSSLSPFEKRQEELPPFETMLRERGVEIDDWKWNLPTELEGGPMFESPDDNLSYYVTKLRQQNIGLQWEREEGLTERNTTLELFKPVLDPQFLVQYWDYAKQLKGMSPFNLAFEFPVAVGKLHGASPHFSLQPTKMIPDASGKYPRNKDYTLATYREVHQLAKFTAAAVSLNNMIFVSTKMLTLRLEDLQTPLEPDRKIERMLCAVVREASQLISEVSMKGNLIATSILRRDNMLRANRDPRAHPVTFSSPIPTPFTFHKYLGIT